MSRQWTYDQALAIEKEGGNILVNAAAGSGKTAVLVERVIRKILSGGTVDRLLIVTFTIKAAREMRERIAAAISKELAKNPGNRHLHRQAVLIQRAKICTIDSFYSSLVKTNFNQLGISPDFKIIDEAEYALLKREVLTNLLESYYDKSHKNSDFIRFVDNFGSDKTDSGVLDTLLAMNRRLESVPFTKSRLAEMTDSFNPQKNTGFLSSGFGVAAGGQIAEGLKYHLNRYNRLLIKLTDLPELYESISGLLHQDLEYIEKAAMSIAQNRWDDFVNVIKNISFDTMRAPRKFTEEPLKIKAQEIRSGLKDYIKSLKSDFAVTEGEYEQDLIKAYPVVRAFNELLLAFDEALKAEKEKINSYCFADISRMALSLCVGEDYNPTPLALELSYGYDEIMIDEYQDTNEIQDLIFTAISNNSKKLFLVGDVKQSIYGFRNACPDIFIRRKDEGNPSEKEKYPMLINLSKNFRSRKEVIEFVNLIFSQLMSRELGGVSYDDSEKLHLGAEYPEGKGYETEVELIDLQLSAEKEEEREESEDEEKTTAEKEALFTADKIKSMLESGYLITDKETGEKRKVRPRDFAILLRSLKNKGEIFRKALEEAGINAFCEEGIAYFDAYEVITVLSILRTIDNPYNDIPLISCMRSPAFFFSSDELAEIRLCDREAPFYISVKSAAIGGNNKAELFLKKLDYYKELSRQLPVYRLLSLIYTDTGLFSLFGGMEGGEQRQNNLNQLIRHAKNYEAGGAKGVYGFISFIDKIIEDKDGNISGVNPAPSSDSVFISTIHKSKGLEYPVCIIASTASSFNKMDERADILFHKDYGFGFQLSDVAAGIKYTTLQRETIKGIMKRERTAEELRVLYVAMTRAKEKLILVGCVKDLQKSIEKAKASAEDFNIERIQSLGNYLDWILACIIKRVGNDAISAKEESTHLPLDDTAFQVHVRSYDSIIYTEKREERKEEKIEDSDSVYVTLKERLDFQYKNTELEGKPVKLSVTELKGRKSDIIDAKELYETDQFAMPLFEGKDKLNAAETGTALHRIMQYLTLKLYCSMEEIEEELSRMISMNILTEQEAKAINKKAIFTFVNSDLYHKIINSKNVVREYRFTVPVPLSQIDTEVTSEETVLVQGVIDCFFEWGDSIIIIDYKTDKAIGKNYKAEFSEKYKIQLTYYKYAVELLFQKRVSKTLIYSYNANEVIEID